MGANTSAECPLRSASRALQEPLLPGPRGKDENDRGDFRVRALSSSSEVPLMERVTSHESIASSAPPSFKATKARKTKDFIGSERKQRETGCLRESPSDIDPRLLDDSDAQPITAKVASLIFHYIEEGNQAMTMTQQSPLDDEFHEAHFLHRRCCGCCPRRSSVQTASVDAVFALISKVASSLYFCKQVVVLCAIYVERLLQDETTVMLTSSNWRSVVVVGLLIASKVWEDVHPWNADFEECLLEVAGLRYEHCALYRLESLFLDKLRWRVFVDGEVYAAYFFSLLEGARPGGMPEGPRRPLLERRHTDTFRIDTIIEDEMYVSVNEGDLESCVMPGDGSQHDRESNASSTPPCSPTLTQCPWSREELAKSWRRSVLEDGESLKSAGAKLRAIHDAWKLDRNNPHIGALRHAPRALAPSARIPQSAYLLWTHELASRTTDMLGPQTPRNKELKRSNEAAAAATLSGATGAVLASELRRYYDGRKEGGSLG